MPRCTRATHIAVPPTFDLGAFSSIKELGMSLWASDRPKAGRRLAAVSYVLDSNCALLPIGRNWAARPLEFIAPDPLIRPLTHGLSVPIPAIADAEKHDKRTKLDLDTRALRANRKLIRTGRLMRAH